MRETVIRETSGTMTKLTQHDSCRMDKQISVLLDEGTGLVALVTG